MNISISGEAASTARDALTFFIFRAEMDSGIHGGTPAGAEAEKRLAEGKFAISSFPGGGSEMPASVSFSDEVAGTVQSALIIYIVQAEIDVKNHGRWTQERGVAKKRLAEANYALQSLSWAISQSRGKP